MPKRIPHGYEKKVPQFSVSAENSLFEEFQLILANKNQRVSTWIRNKMIELIIEERGENKIKEMNIEYKKSKDGRNK